MFPYSSRSIAATAPTFLRTYKSSGYLLHVAFEHLSLPLGLILHNARENWKLRKFSFF